MQCQKKKKKVLCLFCILGYSKHIIFSWKISFFWLGQWIIRNWGVQDPHELKRYCSPIYVLCVSSHFWPFTKANLILENFNKNLGFGQTPPPLVGPNAQLFPKMDFEGPPKFIIIFLYSIKFIIGAPISGIQGPYFWMHGNWRCWKVGEGGGRK